LLNVAANLQKELGHVRLKDRLVVAVVDAALKKVPSFNSRKSVVRNEPSLLT